MRFVLFLYRKYVFGRICCPLHCMSPELGGLLLKLTFTTTLSIFPSIIDTVSEPVFVTYTMFEISLTATRLAIRGNLAVMGILKTGSCIL
jgi:hypothetical protein